MLKLPNKPSESDQSSCTTLSSLPIMQIDPAQMSQTDSVDIYRTIAGIAGNVLEWYDFALFGFFGDVIADVFFPKQSGHAALIESYAVFGAAFIVRPLGGLIIGYIGDKYGRKKALEISIFLMAIPTFVMGLLPSYARIGPLAIVLLGIVRILQGLSVGGQLVSSLVFTVECRPKDKWGWYGSWVFASANFGTFLGGLVAFLVRNRLDNDALLSWGWRVPFLAGIVVGFAGYYLKYYCDDHDFPVQQGDAVAKNPITTAFARENRRSLLSASLVPMLWAGGFYTTYVWMAVFMEDLLENPIQNAFAINSVSLLFLCLWFPAIGKISDKLGRVQVMTVGGVAMGLGSPLFMQIIGKGQSFSAFIAQTCMGFSLSLWGSPSKCFNPGMKKLS